MIRIQTVLKILLYYGLFLYGFYLYILLAYSSTYKNKNLRYSINHKI